MPVPNLQPDNAIHWFSEPGDHGSLIDPLLLECLTDTGLLTARLRRQCGDNFRLQVIEESLARPGIHQNELRRIVLWCGNRASIYAETIIPRNAAEKLPWLRELGSVPLGEALQYRSDVSRGKFEYARIKPAQLPADLPAPIDGDLWARRSEFHVGDTSLLVTEIFLPGMLDCTTPDAQPAEKN